MIFIVGCIFLKLFLKTVLSKLDEYKKSKWLVMKWLACVHTGDCKALICQVGYFIKLLLMRSPDNITVTCIATSGNDVWHLQPTSPASIGNRVPKTCYLFYNMSPMGSTTQSLTLLAMQITVIHVCDGYIIKVNMEYSIMDYRMWPVTKMMTCLCVPVITLNLL